MPDNAQAQPRFSSSVRGASVWRRLGAMIYDAVLLLCVLIVASGVHLLVAIYPYELIFARTYPSLDLIPLTFFRLYLLAVIVGFYLYFWTRGGQTLGLRAWHLRVEREDGGKLDARDALRRLGWATLSLLPLGAGLLAALRDPERRAWYDRKSGTRVVQTG
jgi:uncharacterized RDD family membrane protein YckC